MPGAAHTLQLPYAYGESHEHAAPKRLATPRSRIELRTCVWHAAQLLGRDPNDADAWHDLGVALLALEDRAGACTALRHALRIDSGRAATCLALGELLFDCGQFDAAMELFDRAANQAGAA